MWNDCHFDVFLKAFESDKDKFTFLLTERKTKNMTCLHDLTSSSVPSFNISVDVDQWLEHLTGNQKVPGLNLNGSSSHKRWAIFHYIKTTLVKNSLSILGIFYLFSCFFILFSQNFEYLFILFFSSHSPNLEIREFGWDTHLDTLL